MVPELRREAILNVLHLDRVFYFDDILAKFNQVSASTLRRDLKVLEDAKKIEFLRGGAIRLLEDSVQVSDVDINIKKNLNMDKKKLIAERAAELVNDGDVIYIDSGTTCTAMLDYLIAKKVIIVTSNINLIEQYRSVPDTIEIISVGGSVNRELGSLCGPIAEGSLKDLHFDKAFLGATSINIAAGVSTPNLFEATKKQIVHNNSHESYVLIDSTKFNKFSMCKIFELSECNIITDLYIEYLENCQSYIVIN